MRARRKLRLLVIRKKVDSNLRTLWNISTSANLMDIGTEKYQPRLSKVGSQEVEDLQSSLIDIVTEESQSKPSRVGSWEVEEGQDKDDEGKK